MLTKDTAICIRAVDYSETSQIVAFFTRANGKISAIAKGSKRPKSAFDGPIEMFSHGTIVFADSNKEKLATLTEFQQQAFSTLPTNLLVFNCCLFAAELLNKLTHDYDPHPGLFDSFLRFVQDINERRETRDERREALSLLILFQLTLLHEIGLMPILNACANCNTRYERPVRLRSGQAGATGDELYFSSSANGLLCRDCEASFPDKIRLTKSAAACLTNLKQVAKSDEKTLNKVEQVFIYHFTELLGHRPKMAKHILKA
jgi:DNA repair protein RecO (recombination protein O)